MRISDWSSDVCSSDLSPRPAERKLAKAVADDPALATSHAGMAIADTCDRIADSIDTLAHLLRQAREADIGARSEEHTSELQSLMRNSYAVFCLKKKRMKNKK